MIDYIKNKMGVYLLIIFGMLYSCRKEKSEKSMLSQNRNSKHNKFKHKRYKAKKSNKSNYVDEQKLYQSLKNCIKENNYKEFQSLFIPSNIQQLSFYHYYDLISTSIDNKNLEILQKLLQENTTEFELFITNSSLATPIYQSIIKYGDNTQITDLLKLSGLKLKEEEFWLLYNDYVSSKESLVTALINLTTQTLIDLIDSQNLSEEDLWLLLQHPQVDPSKRNYFLIGNFMDYAYLQGYHKVMSLLESMGIVGILRPIKNKMRDIKTKCKNFKNFIQGYINSSSDQKITDDTKLEFKEADDIIEDENEKFVIMSEDCCKDVKFITPKLIQKELYKFNLKENIKNWDEGTEYLPTNMIDIILLYVPYLLSKEDLEDDLTRRILRRNSRYRYQESMVIYHGLNMRGKCCNENCEAYNEDVWLRFNNRSKGLFQGELENENDTRFKSKFKNITSLTSLRSRCFCPLCSELVDFRSRNKVGFYECCYDLSLEEWDRNIQNNINDKKVECKTSFRVYDLDKMNCHDVVMVVRPLDWKEKKEAKLRAKQEEERQIEEYRKETERILRKAANDRKKAQEYRKERERIEKERERIQKEIKEDRRRRLEADEKAQEYRKEREKIQQEIAEDRRKRLEAEKKAQEYRKEREKIQQEIAENRRRRLEAEKEIERLKRLIEQGKRKALKKKRKKALKNIEGFEK